MEQLLLFGKWTLFVIIGHDLIESTNFRTFEEGGIDGGNCNDKVLPRSKIADSSIIFIIYSLSAHSYGLSNMYCRLSVSARKICMPIAH